MEVIRQNRVTSFIICNLSLIYFNSNQLLNYPQRFKFAASKKEGIKN